MEVSNRHAAYPAAGFGPVLDYSWERGFVLQARFYACLSRHVKKNPMLAPESIDRCLPGMHTVTMSDASAVSKHAAEGGRARAESLSSDERREIARQAAIARWGDRPDRLPRETHDGIIKVLDIEIPCGVLEDGTRIFSTRGVNRVLGSTTTGASKHKESGARQLPYILASDAVRPFISNELMARLSFPREYQPKHGGRSAHGHEAVLLPELCGAILDAAKASKLGKRQERIVRTAEILIRGFARVGIIALVDEATGYQDRRPIDELRKILEAYVVEELRPWMKTFPDEYFRQIYRVHNWDYKGGTTKRSPYVGKFTNRYIYEPLPPGVLEELRKRNPVTEKGYRRHKHFQHLTVDTGIPHLDKQITAVTTILKVSDNKRDYEDNFARAFAKVYQHRLPLVLDDRGKTK